MENIFWGNRKRMNIKYLLLTVLLLILNYLNLSSFESYNFFIPVIWVSLISVGLIFLWKSIHVFTGNNFIENINSNFKRLKLLMYVLIIVLMIMSLVLIGEKRIFILGYDLLFFQRTLAISLFVVTLMNLEVIRKVDEIEFFEIKELVIEPIVEFYISSNHEVKSAAFVHNFTIEEIVFNNIVFNDIYSYEEMGRKLFTHNFLKTKDGLEESTIRNFVKFVKGERLDQILLICDKNLRGSQESTYSCVILLLKNIIVKFKTSLTKFMENRFMISFSLLDFEMKLGSLKQAYSNNRKNQNTDRQVLILEIIKKSVK